MPLVFLLVVLLVVDDVEKPVEKLRVLQSDMPMLRYISPQMKNALQIVERGGMFPSVSLVNHWRWAMNVVIENSYTQPLPMSEEELCDAQSSNSFFRYILPPFGC